MHAEKGCIEYGAAVDAEDAAPFQTKWGADSFLVIEKWRMDALKAHAAAPHMAYGAKTKELIAARVIHILRPALLTASAEVQIERRPARAKAATQLGIPGDLSGYRTPCAGFTAALPRTQHAPS